MDLPETSSKERFSLLLLDPGEIYFEDFAVHFYPANVKEDEAVRRAQRGRLKMCSKSIVFDPKEFGFPVLKFPLKDCKKIEQWTGPLLSRIYNNKSTILIECEQVVEMLENNIIAPFVFKRNWKQWLFSLSYAKVEDCLPQLSQLHRASTLPAADQAAMISAIVQSRQRMVKFDNCWIEDLHERMVVRTEGNHITPLVTNPGRILLTTLRIYFQPFNNVESLPVFKIKLGDIKRIVKRRYVLRHIGIEIYCSENAPLSRLFLSLKSPGERDELYNSIVSQAVVKLDDTQQENMLIKWQNACISNFDYLLYLNSMADRSFNDLTQYPVFPWVISDYSSSELDLDDPSHFRDLSKPIGALDRERLSKLKARYKEMPAPRFLYGSHYSTPGFVLYYLVRKVPLYMLCLHNGRFDHPDRMFNSISDTWKNVTTNSADFKELTPEFYQTEFEGDFLTNSKKLNFGLRQDGKKVDDVQLPKWAEDPRDCIYKMRAALESEYVSQNLHRWIDLVFGCKQKGFQAEKADNVFYYLTYEGAIDLDSVEDLNDRYSLEVQITEFGQVPRQIFAVPHPQKLLSNLTNSLLNEVQMLKSLKIQPLQEQGKRGNTDEWQSMENLKKVDKQKLHKSTISSLCLSSDGNYAFSVSHDSMLKMFSLNEKKPVRNINLTSMALSSCILMPGDKTVLAGSWDNCVYMYSIEYGKILEITTAHDDAVSGIHWNKGILATASWDSTAKIWNYCAPVGVKPHSPAQLLAELDHDTKVTSVQLNSDNSKLVSGTTDGCIYQWDLTTYTVVSKNAVHEGSINAILISPDDQRIISCGGDIKVLDLKTGTVVFAKDEGDEFRCMCWNGQTAIAGGHSGRLYVWDLKSVQLVDHLTAHEGPVTAIAVSPDGTTVASGDETGTIIIWK